MCNLDPTIRSTTITLSLFGRIKVQKGRVWKIVFGVHKNQLLLCEVHWIDRIMLVAFSDRRNSENGWTGWLERVSVRINWQARYLFSKRNFMGKINVLLSDVSNEIVRISSVRNCHWERNSLNRAQERKYSKIAPGKTKCDKIETPQSNFSQKLLIVENWNLAQVYPSCNATDL